MLSVEQLGHFRGAALEATRRADVMVGGELMVPLNEVLSIAARYSELASDARTAVGSNEKSDPCKPCPRIHCFGCKHAAWRYGGRAHGSTHGAG